jgi:quercetin dioxygenase-like cupin family protein
VNDVQHDKTSNPDGNTEPRKPVQAFDSASALDRLRGEKAYEEHGRSVLILAQEPSPRLVLTAIAAGRRTGERRVAGASTVQVLEGEVRFRAGEEWHVLYAGGTLVLQGNVSYDAEAMSDAAFLHTLVQPLEQGQGFSRPVEHAEGRPDLDLPGALPGSHFPGTQLDVPGNLGDRSVVKKAASEWGKETRVMEQTDLPELWEWAEYY